MRKGEPPATPKVAGAEMPALVGDVLMMPLAIAALAWHGELRGVVLLPTGPTGSGGGVLDDASIPTCGEVLRVLAILCWPGLLAVGECTGHMFEQSFMGMAK